MPRPKPNISDATRTEIRRAALESRYPVTAREVRERTHKSDQVVRAVLTELVESDTLSVDRQITPIRYRPRGEMSVHASVWRIVYNLILESSTIRLNEADNLAREIVELIESGPATGDNLIAETRAQVETARKGTKR